MSLRDYHQATRHSLQSVQSDRHGLDWPNQPLPFKIYTSLEAIELPRAFSASSSSALSAIAQNSPGAGAELSRETLARVCYFSNGVTRVLRGMPFRAAACTGALYHIELYAICGALPDVAAGVYHYGAHDHALRQLRTGDFREVLASATGSEPSIVQAPLILALTSTWWRNAWKYRARAYRHAFWDSGTILANLLAVACANGVAARVVTGFADAPVNTLLDVNPEREATICLVALGSGSPPPTTSPPMEPLSLPTRRLSDHEVSYPEIVQAHQESSLSSGEAAAEWRQRYQPTRTPPTAEFALPNSDPIETVITRRGSSRRFTHDSITLAELRTLLATATSPVSTDAGIPSQLYLIVNAVVDLAPGAYVFQREGRQLQPLKEGNFRREASYLDLGQELAGDAAVDVYWLVDLEHVDDRAYRAAQLDAAIEGGKLYLAAYAVGLGATGLTFFDDDVTDFFSPHAQGKGVMFLTAVGRPTRGR